MEGIKLYLVMTYVPREPQHMEELWHAFETKEDAIFHTAAVGGWYNGFPLRILEVDAKEIPWKEIK